MKYWLILLLQCTGLCRAQTLQSWQIVDSLTGTSIPFALVVDETTKRALLTDEQGHFTLPVSDSNHYYFATSIGYDTVRFIPQAQTRNVVHISACPVMLDTFAFIGSKSNCPEWLGYTEKSRRSGGSYNFSSGNEVAVYMPNDSHRIGIISKVKFYIAKDGYPTSKFRAKLYRADTVNGCPAELLVNTDILLHAEKKNTWVEIDLSHLNIPLPANGFFVAMQWLPDAPAYSLDLNRNDTPRNANGQSLGAGKAQSFCTTWIKGSESGWNKMSSFGDTKVWHNAMIAAEILTRCDVNESER